MNAETGTRTGAASGTGTATATATGSDAGPHAGTGIGTGAGTGPNSGPDAGPDSAPHSGPDADAAPAPRRVTARRARTRRRMLDAALEVFAEEGFGRSTVEQVCERAGYTRGAFYSNFSSLDELFLAMWEERSQRMLADVREALATASSAAPEETIRAAVAAIPVDDAWYRVTAEFTAHALRNRSLRRVMAAREQAILDTILPVVVDALARTGRRVPDEAALGQALVAVHDGTSVQVLLEPGSEVPRLRREALFEAVLNAYSTPITEEAL